ncbi:MAG: alpha/beta hydrolase [Myxococcota bacterium]|jgi:alpha-beta hydrolase superfamily lysophospholipase|nr:alpha/beta hydrolase [Myxococcota bacterium]
MAPEQAGTPDDAIRRIEGRLEKHERSWLFRRSWIPREPTRTIALVHGFGEHSGRYEHVGAWFARRGAEVHGFDLRGHGRSSGKRGHVDAFADYLDDLERFLDVVRSTAEGRPVTLIGHSMGGLIVTSLAVERSPDVQSVVTSGAALAVSPDLEGFKVSLAKWLGRLLPRVAMDAGLDPNGICTDAEVVRQYVADPLVHGTSTMSHAAALFDQMDRVRGAGREVGIPMFVTHGALDALCPPVGSEQFHQSLPGAAEGDASPVATLRIYPRSGHEIMNDVEQESVLSDYQTWIEQREADTRSESA